MAYENNDKKMESVYSQRLRAGKRRTYFFDVRETRGNDYYLTITESRKKFNEDGYDRHKIFLYKEDFNKFLKGINEAIDFVKTELMPDYDFDSFNHESDGNFEEGYEKNESYKAQSATSTQSVEEAPKVDAPSPEVAPETDNNADNNLRNVEVDKW